MIDSITERGDGRGLGILGNRIVKRIFTEPDESTIRLISLRKALRHEREEFEESFKNRLGPH